MHLFEHTTETLKSIQIYPSKVRIEPNDKMARSLFNWDDVSYNALMQGAKGSIVEKKNHRKHGEIKTPIKLGNDTGYGNGDPLTEFDRAVLSVCISEFAVGNAYTTPAIIFRALIGKVGEIGIHPMKNQAKAIESSIDKLMFTKFDADATESFEQLKYTNGDEIKIKKSSLLPAYVVDAKINGQELKDIIFFDRESPIFTLANLKNQIVRYDTSLLDVPGNQQNTPRIITVKNYVMRRVCEIKLHKMTPVITFDDIFKKCRMEDASRQSKLDARNVILTFFEHLKAQNFIKSYDIKKADSGNRFYGFSLTF